MSAIINFFKDLLMLNKEDRAYIGLERLSKDITGTAQVSPKKHKREVKLSDLMQHGS